MNNQILIIYENEILYDILYEIAEQIKFSILKLNKKNLSNINSFIQK